MDGSAGPTVGLREAEYAGNEVSLGLGLAMVARNGTGNSGLTHAGRVGDGLASSEVHTIRGVSGDASRKSATHQPPDTLTDRAITHQQPMHAPDNPQIARRRPGRPLIGSRVE